MSDSPEKQIQLLIFVQLTDLYHIDFLMDPTDPGSFVLPHVTTVLQRLRAEYGELRVIFCLPGDFLNPSCLSRTHRSQQMIALLNQMGLSVATFGNHEFDFEKDHFSPGDLAARVSGSEFRWLASNYIPSGIFGDKVKSGSLDVKSALEFELSPEHSVFLHGLMYKKAFANVG